MGDAGQQPGLNGPAPRHAGQLRRVNDANFRASLGRGKRMKYLIYRGVSVAALAAALPVQVAWAQEPAPAPAAAQDATSDDDIIVTAQRRSERLQDVPIAISAVSGESLQERGVSNLQDFTATIPSVNVQQRRSSGVVTVRGIGFEIATAGADPGVAVHADGVYVSRPAAAIANFYDLERIEVARGPQGTLYGRNATGGAVNLITRAPSDTPSGYIDATYGNFNALTVEGALGGPIAEGISARIAFRTDDHDGYGTNLANGNDVNDLNTRAVRARIRIEPSASLRIDLSADYFRQKDSFFTPHFEGPYVPTTVVLGASAPDKQDVNLDQDTINRRTFWGVSANVELDLSDEIMLRSITGYRNHDYYWYNDGDGTNLYVARVGRNEDGHTWSQELQMVGTLASFNWVLGGYYFFEHNYANGFGSIPSINLFNNDQVGILETNSYAVFGQATYNITDALGITVGGRYTTEKKRLLFEATGTLPNRVPRNDAVAGPSTAKFNSFTPKVSIDYKVAPDILIYASVQRGFKSGGYAVGAKTPAFRPETIWSYEAGIKATWLNGALRTNISAFHYDYTDLQVGFIQGLVSVVTNAASAKVDGLEAEITIRPTRQFTIEANGSLLDATYSQYNTTDPNRRALGVLDLSGNRLAQAAKHSGFIAASYEIPAFDGGITLRGEYTFSGPVFFDAFNQPQFSGKGYDLMNAFITYRTADEKWSVSGFVRNLEDDHVAVGGSVGSGLQGAPIQMSYVPPRTYGVRVGYKF
ncbi:TonB-dependent receptor [Novosphingobium sp. BL-52-GroH]|uniref:TonB-dependent receptor n=1 Tax=Novosphingobium sp. BL-52-GroH TaxID=3349877 RepID=UPI00384E08E5